jgi:hypothetical protein
MDEQKAPPPGWRVVDGSDGDVWEHEASGDLVGVTREKSGEPVTLGHRAPVGDVLSWMEDEAERVECDLTWRAKQIDATDEQRLVAGWTQERCSLALDVGAFADVYAAPDGPVAAPGPAGRWRLHASGVWVRWVVPVGGAR